MNKQLKISSLDVFIKQGLVHMVLTTSAIKNYKNNLISKKLFKLNSKAKLLNKKESRIRLISLQINVYLFPKSFTLQISQETMFEYSAFCRSCIKNCCEKCAKIERKTYALKPFLDFLILICFVNQAVKS